jgi:hypothetical protein
MVALAIPTHERLGIAFARTNVALCKAVNKSLASIKERGLFDALRRKWLDESDKDQAGMAIRLVRIFTGDDQSHFSVGEIEWNRAAGQTLRYAVVVAGGHVGRQRCRRRCRRRRYPRPGLDNASG